jgi:hypothetical protein
MAKWKDADDNAIPSWRSSLVDKPLPVLATNNLATWLEYSLDDRISIALTILDHLVQLSDDISTDDRYIQIGTTQNKSSFVFALKGKNNTSVRTFSSYDNDFVELIKDVAIKLEELEYRSEGSSF